MPPHGDFLKWIMVPRTLRSHLDPTMECFPRQRLPPQGRLAPLPLAHKISSLPGERCFADHPSRAPSSTSLHPPAPVRLLSPPPFSPPAPTPVHSPPAAAFAPPAPASVRPPFAAVIAPPAPAARCRGWWNPPTAAFTRPTRSLWEGEVPSPHSPDYSRYSSPP